MHDFNVIVALLGAIVLCLGLLSARLSAGPLPPTLLALATGVVIGPAVLGLVDPARLGETMPILEGVARLTLGIGLVGVALRVPRAYPRRRAGALAILVGVGMLLMWAIATGLVYLILGFPLWLSALIGAMITPTDPIAATAIVTGREAEQNIPEGIRHMISFESGANDSLGFLFVYLPFLMLTRPWGEAWSHWLMRTLLWEVVVATILGILLGVAAAKLLQAAERDDAIESQWRLVYMVGLALFAVGGGRLIGSDEILIAFAAGAAFAQVVSAAERGEEEHGQEAVNRFFAIPIFVLIGTAIPWEGWRALGPSGVLLAACVLLLRRPPVIMVLRPFLPDLRTAQGALFMGWFGPVAVAATYYAALMSPRLDEPVVWHVVSLVVVASVLAHGLSGAAVTRLVGRSVGRRSRGEEGRGGGGRRREPDEAFEEPDAKPGPAEPADSEGAGDGG